MRPVPNHKETHILVQLLHSTESIPIKVMQLFCWPKTTLFIVSPYDHLYPPLVAGNLSLEAMANTKRI